MLYEQLAANRRKSFGIIMIFLALLLLTSSALSYALTRNAVVGLVIAALIAAIYIPIVLSSSKNIVLSMNHATKINEENTDYKFLFNMLEGLALVSRLPVPELYIINEASPNAFATGMNPNKSAIAVTTGLVERLNREEIEGVLAHEMAHIKNQDVRLSTMVLALFSILIILSDFGMRMTFWGGIRNNSKDNNNGGAILLVVSILLVVLAPLVGSIIQYSLSRNREYLADATGAELSRNPLALASALEKISGDQTPMNHVSASSVSLYICRPVQSTKDERGRKKAKKAGLFDTHPPIEERIKRLREM